MTDAASSSQSLGVGERAFRVLFEREVSYVWHTLSRLGVRPDDVRDQAQEVFVVVHRLLPSFDTARPVRPWLFGIALRVASGYRAKAKHRVTQELAEDVVSEAPLPDDQLEDVQKRALVLRALDRVELDRRAVLILVDLDGRPVPEVAEHLGIPLNTAYSRLRLARAEFTEAARRLAAARPSHGGGQP